MSSLETRLAAPSRRFRLEPTDRRDALALEDLYDAHGASCYRLAYRMVAEEQMASTIVRDVFVAVWSGETVLDPARGSVQTWLLGATHRTAVAELRRPHNGSGAGAETFNALALQAFRELAAKGGARRHSLAVAEG
jgi:DNA-directed RNA polymerase specialized sigma24 family protein